MVAMANPSSPDSGQRIRLRMPGIRRTAQFPTSRKELTSSAMPRGAVVGAKESGRDAGVRVGAGDLLADDGREV
jgi:hypothetical protein